MKESNIKKNYIYNLTYQILSMIIPLLTTPYLSRVLGAKNIGIYGYTLSITTYFIMFGSLGIAMYAQREIAFYQKDLEKRSKIFKEIIIFKFLMLSMSLILFYFILCNNGIYKIYYRIFILEIIANILDISWFFQGLEEFKKTVTRNIIVKLISVLSIFMFVKTSGDLQIYILIYVLSTFIGNLSLWFYLPKFIKNIKLKDLNIKRHFKPTLALFIPQIAIQIYTVLDKTMIGIMVLDKAEVGFYEQAQKVVKLLLAVATSLGTVMMPRIASIYASGDRKKLLDYINNSFSFVTLISFPLTFGITSVAYKFVPLFFGSGYEKVAPLMCIISPIIIIIGLSNIIGIQYLLPTKQQKKFTISVVCGAVINFIFNLILIFKFKSIGASIATLIAEFAVTAIQFYLSRNELSFKNVAKSSYKYFVASLMMFFASIVVGSIIVNKVVSIIIQVFVSVIVYFSLLILFKDKFLVNFLKQQKYLKKIFKKI